LGYLGNPVPLFGRFVGNLYSAASFFFEILQKGHRSWLSILIRVKWPNKTDERRRFAKKKIYIYSQTKRDLDASQFAMQMKISKIDDFTFCDI
jgi:hypothetical protein